MKSGARIRVVCLVAALICLSSASAFAQLTDKEIEALRERAGKEGATFTVGRTSATDRPIEQLCGLVVPEGGIDDTLVAAVPLQSSLPPRFDWRDYAGVTPIRDQDGCGSCWAFATVGPLECNIKIVDGIETDLSEQWLVSCNTDGWGCSGGWWAHDYHLWKTDPCGGFGAVFESDFPYEASDVPCGCPYPCQYTVSSWAYIESYPSPSVSAIKQAIIQYGPVASAVWVGPLFQAYTGGVFNIDESFGVTNHGVVLVGWDDSQGTNGVWILRNSWGTEWGEDGYMKIEYGCSMIGYAATYVVYVGNDADGDGLVACEDNCPDTYNPGQEAYPDGDNHGDACDNCDYVENPDQANNDGDSLGNACDNCIDAPNDDQLDSDEDGIGDACDNCRDDANPDQLNADGDEYGDACDPCTDTDGDGVGDPGFANTDCTIGYDDNCPDAWNPGQEDADGDGFGDACDPDVYCGSDPEEYVCDADELQGWMRSIDCSGVTRLTDVTVLDGGDLVFTGYTDAAGDVPDSLILVRTNPCGQIQWRRTYAESFEPDPPYLLFLRGNSVISAGDGGLVVGGACNLQIEQGIRTMVLLAKFDADGNPVWGRYLNGPGVRNHEICHSVARTADGGYVLAGHATGGYPDSSTVGFLSKTDGSGNLLWSQTYEGDPYDALVLNDAREVLNGHYILTGWEGTDSLSRHYVLIKTEANGEVDWKRSDLSCMSVGYSVDEDFAGNYIVAGYGGCGAYNGDLVEKFDPGGDLQWSWSYYFTNSDANLTFARSVRATPDGGCFVTGYTNSASDGFDIYAARLNSVGDSLWTQLFAEDGDQFAFGMDTTSDSCCVTAGYVPGSHAVIVKTLGTDSDGDGVGDFADNCVYTWNPDQADNDKDGLGNECDNCPDDYNPDQSDLDDDGVGDVCEPDCCLLRGDVDHNRTIDIMDVLYLNNWVWGGPPPPCVQEADVDAEWGVDIMDVIYLSNYVFGIGPPPICCPNQQESELCNLPDE
ncbi:MAG: thrombospondin type 3 repeat-containing protein [Candidatus Zixiibacteriota bacterium]|nr:MAG: thrombospondin type 3 repeat-containing protein [candidate division Zixibacteria bacterium]